MPTDIEALKERLRKAAELHAGPNGKEARIEWEALARIQELEGALGRIKRVSTDIYAVDIADAALNRGDGQ